jgi:hypothetical protein
MTAAPQQTPTHTLAMPHNSILEVWNRPLAITAALRRDMILDGALYVVAGWIDRQPIRGGYLGQSRVLHDRGNTSLRHWVLTQRRITPCAIAQLTFPAGQPSPDTLKLIEARTIQGLSARNLALVNTHSSAREASRRLTRTEALAGQHLADELTEAIWIHVFASTTNAQPTLAPNAREHAVRTVLRSARALDVFEIDEILRTEGFGSSGKTPDFSIRRDLNARERTDTRGRPRVFSTIHRGRRLFWSPEIPKHAAIAGYDATHRRLSSQVPRAA